MSYSTKQLKAQLRQGDHAWPGGYPLYFFTSDGAALSFEAVRENFRSVIWSIRNKVNDGWRVVGCDINYEDTNLYCDHTGKLIESAYGGTEEEKIVSRFYDIMNSTMFKRDGCIIDLPQALIELADAVHNGDTDESTWSLGESLECDLGSLIVGAYWACSEWHGGQSSDTYAALCSLGRVYSPGMANGPEEDTSEVDAYNACCAWFESKYGKGGSEA